MQVLGGNEIGKLLERKGTLLEGVGLFEIRLSKLPGLSVSGATMLGNCVYKVRDFAWHQKGLQELQGIQALF